MRALVSTNARLSGVDFLLLAIFALALGPFLQPLAHKATMLAQMAREHDPSLAIPAVSLLLLCSFSTTVPACVLGARLQDAAESPTFAWIAVSAAYIPNSLARNIEANGGQADALHVAGALGMLVLAVVFLLAWAKPSLTQAPMPAGHTN